MEGVFRKKSLQIFLESLQITVSNSLREAENGW